MKTVRDDNGTHYLLLKRSHDASLVKDPHTGDEQYIDNDQLELVDDESPLETVARSVDPGMRQLLATVHDDRSLGLVIELTDRGPMSVRVLLDRYDFCESELLGRLTTFRAAGVLEETTVHGEQGYRVNDECKDALATIRQSTGTRSQTRTE